VFIALQVTRLIFCRLFNNAVSHGNIVIAKYYSGELGEMCMVLGEGDKIIQGFGSDNSGSSANVKGVAYGF
jgi:hypothetical protein